MSVDPSSLIFVVIVGIWAVYLVQNWVRRREQVATSRSVDRFSEAMRVLERRAPIPVELPTPNRVYAVSSAPVLTAPKTAGRALPTTEVAMKQVQQQVKPQVRQPVRRRPVTSAGPIRRTHRVRALILLTLLVATPVVWGAHLFGTLLLWPTMSVTLLLLLDLLYVRAVVGRERIRRRRTMPRGDRQPAARPAARPAPRQVVKPPAAARPAAVSRTAPAQPAAEAPVHSQEAVTEVIVRDEGWQPVAVPRPTYAMKAKAERPATGSAPLVAESDSAPVRSPEPARPAAEPLQPAVAVDEFDLDAVLDRRRAAGA